MTVATALAVSWKPLTNSKPRAISSETQKDEGKNGLVVYVGKVVKQAGAGVTDSDDKDDAEDQHADLAGRAGKFLVEYARCSGHGVSSVQGMKLLNGETIRKNCYGSMNVGPW
jgi:hypothetical protein